MWSFQHQMFMSGDERGFLLGITAPQQKNYPLALVINQLDGFVSKDFPAPPLMRAGLRLLYRQGRIEK